MAHKPHKETGIFINEVSSHQRRYHKVLELTHSTTKAAGVMLLGAIIALVVANTAAHGAFTEFWHTEVSFGFGAAHAEMSLAHIINDVLMAIFFLLVGLEIKYEMTVGELTDVRQAILPVAAAIGGVLMPVGIYLLFNANNPETVMGWGVPTATDIAFALGILALLGSRVPAGLRVFLSTLAVADDIVAILVIAVFYGQSPSLMWLAAAAVVMVVLVVLNRTHVYSLVPYLLVGVVLWYCIFMSGVHSTIAGVLLAFAIPSRSHVKLKSFASWSGQRVKEAEESYVPGEPVIGQTDYLASVTRLARVSRQVVPPATRLERRLYPWVYFAILPLFALTNADGQRSPEHVLASACGRYSFEPYLLGRVLRIGNRQACGHHAYELRYRENEAFYFAGKRELAPYAWCGAFGRRGLYHVYLCGQLGFCRCSVRNGCQGGHFGGIVGGGRFGLHIPVLPGKGSNTSRSALRNGASLCQQQAIARCSRS